MRCTASARRCGSRPSSSGWWSARTATSSTPARSCPPEARAEFAALEGQLAGAHDNRPVARQILALRQRQATLMGCASYADFKLIDTMAQTRARVWALLDEAWTRALPALDRERALLREAMASAGVGHPLEAWDWRYWAEQVRQARYALDDAALKPCFALPNMVAAAFECAQRLFGLQFVRRAEVLEADGWNAFGEAGGAFDPAVAARLKAEIYSRGDSVEPGAAFRAFRGRDPRIEAMLRERGLLD